MKKQLKRRLAKRLLVERLLVKMFGKPPAKGHAQVREMLPKYVDAELEGKEVARLYPGTTKHLGRCARCFLEYVELLGVSRADLEGRTPIPAKIPKPDLSFLPKRRVGKKKK